MTNLRPVPLSHAVDVDWVPFPGGELEGKRPKARCPRCRVQPTRPDARAPLCFQCYCTELDRERALKAAGELDTASDERFQTTLPFEPIDLPRLRMLRAERVAARDAGHLGVGRYIDRRHQAQIAARHALEQSAVGAGTRVATMDAIHAAELQLPDAWLPFVVSR